MLSTVQRIVRSVASGGAGRLGDASSVPPQRLGAWSDERQPSLAGAPVRATGDTLPSLVAGARAPGWWGIVLLLAIETVVATSLITSYLYLRAHAPRWPPGGIDPPELLLPIVSTAILLLSMLPAHWSVRALERGRRGQHLIALAVTIVMGIVFLVLKYIEYSDSEYIWSTNAYGSIVWTLVGFHTLHLIAALLKAIGILVASLRGFFTPRRYVAVQTNRLYWLFVVIVWIPLFTTIYILPRVL
jgi:cytochrome c oxidase subunit III